ncbi:IclR family transcriptional regulator [Caulobacter sp. X]|uniref:IclR family transcriptional regulator n=1 Tax=Caulobacter sp. X TaxID=2048901 RepID=UPI000C152A89|nr:IclR family transcriptional regulator [Caulobacter sp. X]PIB95248.1 hypothetical protein CSW60_22110 [Caulobacter sp. X]
MRKTPPHEREAPLDTGLPESASAPPPEGKAMVVPALAKALDIFEILADASRGLTIAQIAREAGRTISEIYRIVIYLSERGYLEKNPDTDRYVLTLRLFQLASTNAPAGQLVRRAMPILESIAYRTEQSCHLAILSGQNVLVLASEPSPRHAGYAVRTGAAIPVRETSSGVVILAFVSDDRRERQLGGFLPTERNDWLERIERVRRQGHELRDSTLVQGVRNLSAPVFDHRGVVAALTMGYIGQSPQRVGIEEALRELKFGAEMLSRKLGAREGAPITPGD